MSIEDFLSILACIDACAVLALLPSMKLTCWDQAMCPKLYYTDI